MDRRVTDAIADGLASLADRFRHGGLTVGLSAFEVKKLLADEASRIFNEAVKPPYGYCPHCEARGVSREDGLCGNDRCANGHVYPSQAAREKPRG